MVVNSYLFTSQRLGFRNWAIDDLNEFSKINNDDDVMEFFPFKPSREESKAFILRMQKHYEAKKFCYFAVDHLKTKKFIGFIGLCSQSYITELSPFVDIGWRLKKSIWNRGFATEGARACLDYGFNKIGLQTIYSVASEINVKSELIMKKIGMHKIKNFKHPKLNTYPALESCVFYKISNPDTTQYR
ncbi:GNAT family N-acetyltransferase [Aquimarina addita]|uniref:GNAT family N-acetyltransferase n=1 Tax=Aquimarina addita TaxID=870485 RepID=A0ABP6UP23_9FLAO